MSVYTQLILFLCIVIQISFGILLVIKHDDKAKGGEAWPMLAIMSFGLALYPLASWIYRLDLGAASYISERLITTAGLLLCCSTVNFFYYVGWGRFSSKTKRLFYISAILAPLSIYPGFSVDQPVNFRYFGTSINTSLTAIYVCLIIYCVQISYRQLRSNKTTSITLKVLIRGFLVFTFATVLFDMIPYVIWKYQELAFLGPMSGLVFSGALYWACWKKNFFKLRESLNLLSLIILTILVTTGFVIPIGQELAVKIIIIALCIGLVIDVWRKDVRLKINYRRARREIKELKAAQLSASTYLMDLAHRLKSPLRAIGQLLSGLFTKRSVDQPKLDRARSVAANTGQAMKNLLLAGRIDHQDATITKIPFNLTAQLQEWQEEWIALCPEHHLVLKQPSTAVELNGDQNALKDALTNLVDNARKHSPTGSQITITLKCVEEFAELSVSDEGRGIPLSAQKLIFQRHYQHNVTEQKEVTSSAGLGLHLAKWVAEQHGGEIYVRSRPDRGATFSIIIPLMGKITRAGVPGTSSLNKRVRTQPLRLQ